MYVHYQTLGTLSKNKYYDLNMYKHVSSLVREIDPTPSLKASMRKRRGPNIYLHGSAGAGARGGE
jgi:hypothetical protein